MILPKQDRLFISPEKLTKYALDTVKEPNKALAFRLALGFDERDADLLGRKIRLGVGVFNAVVKTKDVWGQRYQVIIKMVEKAGKPLML